MYIIIHDHATWVAHQLIGLSFTEAQAMCLLLDVNLHNFTEHRSYNVCFDISDNTSMYSYYRRCLVMFNSTDRLALGAALDSQKLIYDTNDTEFTIS